MKQPPLQPTPVGALRFNTDSSKLEYYDGNQWVNITSTSPEAQTGGPRVISAGGYAGSPAPSYSDYIEYANIDSTGNTADFGDMQGNSAEMGCVSSRTRGVTCGGSPDVALDYITIATTGNAIDFGQMTQERQQCASFCNSIRGIVAGGMTPAGYPNFLASMDYITIAQTGTSQDFGDLVGGTYVGNIGVMSPTRGISLCGRKPAVDRSVNCEYVNIATTGDATYWGDLSDDSHSYGYAASNAVRGVIGGGSSGPSPSPNVDTIDYIIMASLGGSVSFGDLSGASGNVSNGGASSPTRMVFMAGQKPAYSNAIEYVQIMSTGNAVDFGDMTSARDRSANFTNGHGGLG